MGRGQQFGQVAAADACGQSELLKVRADSGGAGIFAEVAVLGIDQYRDAPFPSPGDDRLAKFSTQGALGVVGENDRVGGAHQFQRALQQCLAIGGGMGFSALYIQPQQLLITGDDPGLRNRGMVRNHHSGEIHAGCGEQCTQFTHFPIVTPEACLCDLDPQADEVHSHVGGAAGRAGGAHRAEYRHRSLGRNAVNITPDRAIQHHIANHQDTKGCKSAFNQGEKAGLFFHQHPFIIANKEPVLRLAYTTRSRG